MKAKHLIRWLQEKNPEAEIFVSEEDSKFYYEFQGLETFLKGKETGSEHTVLINFDKKKKKNKEILYSKENNNEFN